MAVNFSESALIDDKVLQGIEDCIDLAPLHNPNNIKGILAARDLFGKDVPQVAVFDTSFHHSIPERAYLYALPYHLYRRHRIRRYGFHGTSHRYVAFRYRALRGLSREQTNIISLHLGNGCSAAAIQGGISVDTSMGMTPLEGLVMGTRSGDLDPAIVNVIGRKEGCRLGGRCSAEYPIWFAGHFRTHQRYAGTSGGTERARRPPRSAGHRDLLPSCPEIHWRLSGLDGRGRRNCLYRRDRRKLPRCPSADLRRLGLGRPHLDAARNQQTVGSEGKISTEDSKLLAYAIPTDEELLIARDTVRVIQGVPHPS